MSLSTADLGLHARLASREASCEKASTASFPHAPYVSATRGTHNQLSSFTQVWKLVRTKFPSFKVDLAFLLVYVLGIASSVVLVLWVGFEVRLGFALSITITTEQVCTVW